MFGYGNDANEFNTKEKQKLTEIKKLTATYTSSPHTLIPISIEYIKKAQLQLQASERRQPTHFDLKPHKLAGVYEGYFK